MDNNEPKGENSTGNSYLKFTGMAFQMLAIIGLFTWGGYEIDKNAHHTTQWVTAVLSLTGVLASLYLVIRSVKNG